MREKYVSVDTGGSPMWIRLNIHDAQPLTLIEAKVLATELEYAIQIVSRGEEEHHVRVLAYVQKEFK